MPFQIPLHRLASYKVKTMTEMKSSTTTPVEQYEALHVKLYDAAKSSETVASLHMTNRPTDVFTGGTALAIDSMQVRSGATGNGHSYPLVAQAVQYSQEQGKNGNVGLFCVTSSKPPAPAAVYKHLGFDFVDQQQNETAGQAIRHPNKDVVFENTKHLFGLMSLPYLIKEEYLKQLKHFKFTEKR